MAYLTANMAAATLGAAAKSVAMQKKGTAEAAVPMAVNQVARVAVREAEAVTLVEAAAPAVVAGVVAAGEVRERAALAAEEVDATAVRGVEAE